MSNYAKAIKEMLKNGETIENLSKANHIALDTNKINLNEFLEAAKVLAEAFLK